jgi:hypothetical protein
MQFHSKRVFLWRFNAAHSHKNYLCIHVNCPIFYPISTRFGFSGQIFIKATNIECHGTPSSDSRADTCGRADGQTDMTKVIGALRDYVKALYNDTKLHIILF